MAEQSSALLKVIDHESANVLAEPLEPGVVIIARNLVGKLLGSHTTLLECSRELSDTSREFGGEYYCEPDYSHHDTIRSDSSGGRDFSKTASKLFEFSDFASSCQSASFFWHPCEEGEVIAPWHADSAKMSEVLRVVAYLGDVTHSLDLGAPIKSVEESPILHIPRTVPVQTVEINPGDAFIMTNSFKSRVPHRVTVTKTGFRMICVVDFIGPFSTLDLRVPEDV